MSDSNIIIETSSDTVEQVKEALGSTIEIDESPSAEQTETEEPPAEEQEPEAGENETETEEEGPEAATTEEEPEEGKPAKKPATHTVPLSRLNKEIERRKRAEQRLAERSDESEEEPETTKEKKEETAEKRPQFFSDEPEPQLDTFMKDVDELDGKAVAKATAAFSKAYSDWSRKEARAEAAYNTKQEQARAAWLELTEPFVERRDSFVTQYPEYTDIVGKSQVNLSAEQQEFVYESEFGPQVLWYFTEHPREATRIQSLGKRAWSEAMLKVEAVAAKKWPAETQETTEEPTKRTPPPTKKPIASKAPEPPSRIKSHSPGPKSEQELAGPQDRTGVDIEFNPELERRDKAKRGAT